MIYLRLHSSVRVI